MGTNQLHRILGLLVTTVIATVYIEMFARRKFSTISLRALIGKNVIMQNFCPVLNTAEDMAIFNASAKIFPANVFSNTNIHVARVGKTAKIFLYTVHAHVHDLLQVESDLGPTCRMTPCPYDLSELHLSQLTGCM